MNNKELEFILEEGEGLKLEFKEALNNLDRELVSFANSAGGRIFLGVSDDKKVKGIKVTNKLKSQVQDVANNCDPKIKIKLEEFKNILIIHVEEGEDKPYKCSSGFYLRQGPNSQKMKRDEIINLIHDSGKVKFDEKISNQKNYDKNLVKEFLRKAGIKQTAGSNVLYNLGASNEKGFLNNAGILFFTNFPKKILINAYITCVRYKGTEKVNIIDRKDFENDIVSQIEQAIEFVKRNTRLEYEIKDLYRKEIPEYPIEAIREAILNAVMHRDYFERGANVQVDIFDNKLTITNIGGLIKPLTKENLGKIAVRRNSIIADLFHRIHLVEKAGTGIKRIKEECKKHGNIKFEIETNGYFIAAFKLKTVEKTVEKILYLIKENSKITQEEISEKTGLTRRGIEWNLSNLKKQGILKRIGGRKGGYWKIEEAKK